MAGQLADESHKCRSPSRAEVILGPILERVGGFVPLSCAVPGTDIVYRPVLLMFSNGS